MEETALRLFRRAGLALLIALLAAGPSPALESSASAQASSPANSSQTVVPVAGTRAVKNTATATELRPDAVPRWESLGQSSDGRRIEFAQFGQGVRHVLVVGPLVGDEPAAASLTSRLAEHLARFPRRLNDTTVTIVRDPNPDGHARRTAGNAHGVLLDRNFRTSDWRKVPVGDRQASGREPESESETKALADLLADIKPELVVSLSAAHGRAMIHYRGPAEELARRVSVESRLPVAEVANPESGSLMTYTGIDRGIATLRLTLPARATPQANWTAYKRALLLAVGCAEEESTVAAAASKSVVAGAATSPSPPTPASLKTLARRGEGGNAVTPLDALRRTGVGRNADTPVRTVAGSGAATGPPLLKYEDLQHGLPVVPVKRSAASTADTASRPRTQPPATSAFVAPTGEAAILRRLPPADRIVPAGPIPHRSRLPQAPIPLYPETGYE